MPQISGSGSLSDNEMNIVWFNPAVGTSNQQTMRRGDHCSRGNERAGTEAQVSVRHVDPSNGRPGPFPGGTGNRLLGVTKALGWPGRGLAGVGTLGVGQSGDLPSLNEDCASVVAICEELSRPNARQRKMRFGVTGLFPEARATDRATRSGFGTLSDCNMEEY
jgi:hypothetical protein